MSSRRRRDGTTKEYGKKSSFGGAYGETTTTTINESEKEELDKYFQKKYFENRDSFKYKIDDDSPYNMTRKLYNKVQDKKENDEEEHVMFFPYTFKAYYAHKSELKYQKTRHIFMQVMYDYRVLFFTGLLLAAIFGFGNLYLQSNDYGKKPENNKKNLKPAGV